MKRVVISLLCGFLLSGLTALRAGADEAVPCETLMKQKDEALLVLRKEKAALEDKIKTIECTPTISGDALLRKNYQRLQEVAVNTRAQRQAMAEFEGFVKWMTGNLSGYAKYVEAGSVAAGFAKVLPIPYAGQASLLTKFVSQGILSLNAASVSINRYLGTSQQFLARVDAIDPARELNGTQISDAARFADEQLLRDMNDVQTKLATTSDISASSLSFLETVNQYVGSTDEYWNKTKSFVTRKETDKKEKSFISSSIDSLKNRAGSFNAKLKTFDESAKKDVPLIKNLAAYDDLVRELDLKAARARQEGKSS